MNVRSILLAATLTVAIATANAQTTSKPPTCRDVSVEGDATYCIDGPVCSGAGDKPAATACPKVGDVAVKDCLKKLKSYTNADKCVAPVNAECKKIKTGAWGCVWAATATTTPAPVPGTTTPKPTNATATPATTPPPTTTKPATQVTPATTPPPTTTKPATQVTPATQATPAGSCREVSVEGDATFCIAGPVCSGKGEKAASTACPKVGDVAVKDCVKSAKSYTSAAKCVAPVNAECKKGKGDVWGCVWSAVATTSSTPTPTGTTKPPTTAPVATTTAPTTMTPAPTTRAPTVLVATNLGASSEDTSAKSNDANAVGVATAGVVAGVAIAAAVFVARRKHQAQKKQAQADLRDHVNIVTP